MRTYSIVSRLKKLSIVSAALVLSSFSVLAAGGITFADDTPCTPPSGGSGVNYPSGADAGTYTYQCSGSYAGEWTNPYYVYNPSTGKTSPLYSPDYSYDCASGTWTMTHWDYSPASRSFVSSRIAPSAAPNLPTGCPAPAASTPAAPSSGGNSNASSSGGTGGSTVSDTGPGSNNSANNTVTLNGTVTNNTGLNMNNGITSNALTGNALVQGNTTAGSAASGDAQSVANIANLLQSTSNVFGPNTAVFTANINGDVNGDFMFDPSAILASGPGSNNNVSNNMQVNTNNTNNTNAAINNSIDVGATSGNATVAGNTTGGDATSGNASAVVNLMNLINSTVAAGQSFVGTININGDLNGDILLPPDVLNQLLASTGPNSNNSASTNLTNTSNITNNLTATTTNNITSTTKTGNATVADNTTGGTATSGNSGTNVTLLNLTGSNTIGKNDLLVFVNVLGKWVGMIMNAPSGSTAAELGNGVTDTGPNSNNSASTNVNSTNNTTNNTNLGITNDVNVHATSGDATVADNTTGGNAKSGNAQTAVNILNLTGSNLSLSNWFGVLFINVFGIWNGSFGINTSAGDPLAPASTATSNPVQAVTHNNLVKSFRQFAGFSGSHGGNGGSANPSDTNTTDPAGSAVLGSATTVSKTVATASNTHPTPDNQPHASYLLPIIGVCLAGTILLASERDRIFGRKG
jgi:hypothetical protein